MKRTVFSVYFSKKPSMSSIPAGMMEKNENWLTIRCSMEGGSTISMAFPCISASYSSGPLHASWSILKENAVVFSRSMIFWYFSGSRLCSSSMSILQTTQSCLSMQSRSGSVRAKFRLSREENDQSSSLVGNPWCCPRIICRQMLDSMDASSKTAYLVKFDKTTVSSVRLLSLQTRCREVIIL